MMQDHISQHIKFRHTFFDDRDYWEERNRKLCSFFVMPAGGSSGAGYRIARSLRFNAADSAKLERTIGVASTSDKLLTLNMWVKLCSAPAVRRSVFLVGSLAGGGNLFLLEFNAGVLSILFDGAGTYWPKTSALFRDFTGWMNINIRVDTTQAIAADRCILEVNGVTVPFTSGTMPPQNHAIANGIGSGIRISGFSTIQYPDIYVAEIRFIDGQALDASHFGEFNSVTGAFEPKAYPGTYGNNGGYWDFSDNSAATATAIGADRSGNGNNLTPTNISVTVGPDNDSLTDTPTNWGTDTGLGGEVRGNYATWNPLVPTGSTLSNGNLTVASPTGVSTVRASQGITSGKWYWEVAASANGHNMMVGLVKEGASTSSYPGVDANGWGYFGNSGVKYTNGSFSNYGSTFSTQVIGVLFDADAGDLTFYLDGVSQGVAFSGLTNGPYFPAIGSGSFTVSVISNVNFGQRPFAYPAPPGAKCLCTQNLPNPTIKNPSKGFVATTGSGANIQTALAALRSGWTDYIEIFKRLDSAEGWRWRFSDDAGNYLDSSSQNAKAAFPTLSGTSYVGYAIRCDAGYPARTGEQAHTNGVATTIMHNLGNARALICVKNAGAGSTDWWVYHPDATAGELLKLNSTDADAANTTITNVGANSFDIGSAAATGTYRWFIIAETEGFFDLGKYTGNASSNGPSAFCGLLPALALVKRSDGSEQWSINDNARDPYNPAVKWLSPNSNVAEGTVNPTMDFLANGIKLRVASSPWSSSGGTYLFAAFAKTAFKYARAA